MQDDLERGERLRAVKEARGEELPSSQAAGDPASQADAPAENVGEESSSSSSSSRSAASSSMSQADVTATRTVQQHPEIPAPADADPPLGREGVTEDDQGPLFMEEGGDAAMEISSISLLPDAALISDISRSLSSLGAKFRGDVAEVFCTDRFTSRCREFGLHPGVALDKTLGCNVVRQRPLDHGACL